MHTAGGFYFISSCLVSSIIEKLLENRDGTLYIVRFKSLPYPAWYTQEKWTNEQTARAESNVLFNIVLLYHGWDAVKSFNLRHTWRIFFKTQTFKSDNNYSSLGLYKPLWFKKGFDIFNQA